MGRTKLLIKPTSKPLGFAVMLRRVGGGERPSPWVSQQLAEMQAFQERETKSRIRRGGVGSVSRTSLRLSWSLWGLS